MTWVIVGAGMDGEVLYGRLDDDGLIRVTCIAEHPEFAEWLEEGNEPEIWDNGV